MHDQRPDRELSGKGIGGFAVVLTLVIALSFVAMWGMLQFFERSTASRPTDVPPLPDLALEPEITAPRLQTRPEADWLQMKDEEAAELASYRMLDEESGRVQIPIEAAMQRLLEDGLPAWTAQGERR